MVILHVPKPQCQNYGTLCQLLLLPAVPSNWVQTEDFEGKKRRMSPHNVLFVCLHTPREPLTYHTQFVDSLFFKTITQVAVFVQDPYFIRKPPFLTPRRYSAVACGAVGQVRYINMINKPIARLNSQFSNKIIILYSIIQTFKNYGSSAKSVFMTS